MSNIVTFHVDPNIVIRNIRRQLSDFNSPGGIIGENIVVGMNEVYNRVKQGFKKGFKGRKFLNANAGYSPTPAPKNVIRKQINAVLDYEKGRMYNLTVREGIFSFGIGDIPDLDAATDEVIMSKLKAVMGETPEINRSFVNRVDTHKLWSIIEFGAKPRTFGPITKPFLIFYSHKEGKAAFAKSVNHPGQPGKHIFLKEGHKIYQEDMKAITNAIRKGIHESNIKYHGKAKRRRG